MFDLIDAEHHGAELGIDEDQLVDGQPLRAPDVQTPD
jgi:hypothetical protein